jgi:peptide-methionine (S)-S-oxide reductase
MVKGIITTKLGYMGGQSEAPTYKDVCTGNTGHAEVMQLAFDSQVISFR